MIFDTERILYEIHQNFIAFIVCNAVRGTRGVV